MKKISKILDKAHTQITLLKYHLLDDDSSENEPNSLILDDKMEFLMQWQEDK